MASARRIAFCTAVAIGPLCAATPSASAETVAPACAPRTLEASAARAGGAVTVSPTPNTVVASARTQISVVGVPATQLALTSVVGQRSGHHAWRVQPYSQGDGASFLPTVPFAEGEVVTVHALLRRGGASRAFAWHFTTAEVDRVSRSLETPPPPPPPPQASELQHFVTRPDLLPPTVTVTTDSSRQAPGDVFLAPYAGPGQYGPMILDNNGGLLWFKRVPAGARAADLRVQEWNGQPVLTWWQDPLVAAGHSGSGVAIMNVNYQLIGAVRAGNGFEPDLHAFEITPRGTALMTVYDAVRCDLAPYGGPADGAVADTVFQEVDLGTGLVRFEWHALDHVALASSYQQAGPTSPHAPWDYFHINAVQRTGGDILVDSRNTWAAYEVQANTGQIAWRLGGKQSSFTMGPGASPAWQHDARMQANGTITFFDNGATPIVHQQSRAIVVQLNLAAHTASLVSSFTHPKPLVAASQGDFEPLEDGDWSVGWGQEPFLSEYGPGGEVLFDAHLPARYQSYTVLKFPWSATPAEPPRVAVRPAGNGIVAYVSWNGATGVTAWRVLAGSTPATLVPVAEASRSGFETAIPLSTTPGAVVVQALDSGGTVIGSSPPVAG